MLTVASTKEMGAALPMNAPLPKVLDRLSMAALCRSMLQKISGGQFYRECAGRRYARVSVLPL